LPRCLLWEFKEKSSKVCEYVSLVALWVFADPP